MAGADLALKNMGNIFVSYRRSDSEGHAGRLFRDLCDHFGKHRVLIDVVGMEKGRDFRRTIEQRLETSNVLLAIIGKTWVSVQDPSGHRRLENPSDLVRLETATALRKDIAVIPVLVGGAVMPREAELPDDLKNLAYRDGVEITHARWDSDVQHLIAAVASLVNSESVAAVNNQKSPPNANVLKRRVIQGAVGAAIVGVGGWGASRALVWYEDETNRKAVAQAEEQRRKEVALKAEIERAAKEQLERERAARDKAESERAEAARQAAERMKAEKAAADRAAAERIAAQRASEDYARATSLSFRVGESKKLDELIAGIRSTDGIQLEVIIVVGHTDSTPEATVSQRASIGRAEAVKKYLITNGGIERNRIYTEGKGFKEPIGDNKTAEGRAANNRAEVEIVGTVPAEGSLRKKVTFARRIHFG